MKLREDVKTGAILLYFTGAASPIAVSGLFIILEWFHQLSGGGEWTLGTIMSFIALPTIILFVPLGGLVAIGLSLYLRTSGYLFLAVLQSAILVMYAIFGFDIVTRVLEFEASITLMFLAMVVSSVWVFFNTESELKSAITKRSSGTDDR